MWNLKDNTYKREKVFKLQNLAYLEITFVSLANFEMNSYSRVTGFFLTRSEACAEVGEKMVYARDPKSFAIR